MRYPFLFISLLCLLPGCVSSTDPSTGATSVSPLEAANPLVALPTNPLGIPGSLNQLAAAPTTKTVRLGRWLFHDTRLSLDNTISCASCHESGAAFSNTTATALGIAGQHGTRKAMTIVNLAFAPRAFFFWDGRAASLEAQAQGPIQNPVEMGMTIAAVEAKLQAVTGYAPYFTESFGDSTVNITRISKAIADYERTRLSGNSAFDQWRANNNASYPTAARAGFALFNQVGCNRCHGGPLFSDFNFHNTGVAWDTSTQTFKDLGRSAISGNNADRGAFKTPTLRDLASRAPYMHDGSIETLREVVEFYNQGGISNPNLDRAMNGPLNLSSDQMDDLVAFLETLSGQGYADSGPELFPQ